MNLLVTACSKTGREASWMTSDEICINCVSGFGFGELSFDSDLGSQPFKNSGKIRKKSEMGGGAFLLNPNFFNRRFSI